MTSKRYALDGDWHESASKSKSTVPRTVKKTPHGWLWWCSAIGRPNFSAKVTLDTWKSHIYFQLIIFIPFKYFSLQYMSTLKSNERTPCVKIMTTYSAVALVDLKYLPFSHFFQHFHFIIVLTHAIKSATRQRGVIFLLPLIVVVFNFSIRRR